MQKADVALGRTADSGPVCDLFVYISNPLFQLRQIGGAKLRHLLRRVAPDRDPVSLNLVSKRHAQSLKLIEAESVRRSYAVVLCMPIIVGICSMSATGRFRSWASAPKADIGLQAGKRSPSTSAKGGNRR